MTKPPLPARISCIKPFLVMDILERAQQLEAEGREVIHLEVGEPDFDTPEVVTRAAESALRAGHTHYTTALGLPELREAIADFYRGKYGVSISPERVVVTNGTSPGMLTLFSALIEAEEEVIISDPHYACYPAFILSACGKPVLAPTRAENGFAPEADAVRGLITPKTRAILVNSPSNPTGASLSRREMEALSALGKPIVSDEIYHGLSYGEAECTALEFSESCFIINGFSKYFAMTGWRIGYLIVPPEYVRPLEILQQNYFVSANAFVQRAAIAALREGLPEAERMRGIYDERRKIMIARLQEIGLEMLHEPTGAFYAFADAREHGANSLALAKEILEATGVAVAPGADFGPAGEGFLRFSYCNSIENIETGLEKVGEFLRKR